MKPGFAQGGAGPWPVPDAARPDPGLQHNRAVEGDQLLVQAGWQSGWGNGGWHNDWKHKRKHKKKGKGGNHSAPFPLAGGLPALVLMGAAVAAARGLRLRKDDPPGGDDAGGG